MPRALWLIETFLFGLMAGFYTGAYVFDPDAFKAMTELFLLMAIGFPLCIVAVFGSFGAIWAVCRLMGKKFP